MKRMTANATSASATNFSIIRLCFADFMSSGQVDVVVNLIPHIRAVAVGRLSANINTAMIEISVSI